MMSFDFKLGLLYDRSHQNFYEAAADSPFAVFARSGTLQLLSVPQGRAGRRVQRFESDLQPWLK